jgi:hypothetical protein
MRAGSTLMGVRGGTVRLGGSCDSQRDAWLKKHGSSMARTECARGFKGKHGCDKNFPSWCATWGHPWGAAAASPPATATPTTIAPTESFFGSGATYTPATPPSGLTNAATPPPTPAPEPTPAPTPTCSQDWASAAAEIRSIAASVRSCQSPHATIPGLLANCQGSTGSYDDYLRARDEYAGALDDAVLCETSDPATENPTTTTVIPSGGSGTTVIQAPGSTEELAPTVEPDTSPIFSRGAKVGAGIGGVLVVGLVVVLMMRGKRTRRSSRRA